MDEKKLLDQIRESASGLTPPDSLSPDAIEKLLSRKNPKKKKYSAFRRFAATAAVFVLCAASLWQIQKIQKYSAGLERQISKDENLIEKETAALKDTADTAEPAAESGGETSSPSAAGSYEEIYQALYKEFYFPDYLDDTVYDMGTAAATAEAGTGIAVQSVPDLAQEDGAALSGEIAFDEPEMAAEFAEEEMEADDSMYVPMEDSAPAEMDGSLSGGTAESSAQTTSSSFAGAAKNGSEADYSTTNIQELGVDEADIVKTDGRFLYILRHDGSVAIADISDPKAPAVVSVIAPASSGLTGTQELYVDGDTLNVIASCQNTTLEEIDGVYVSSTAEQTALYTYDISDPKAPVLTGTVTQDGAYETSRKNGTYLYLFTSYYPDIRATYEESSIVPAVNGNSLRAEDLYLPEHLNSSSYLLISSVDIRRPKELLAAKAFVSGTSNYYVSTENIYIANEDWHSSVPMTEIMKFHYEDGAVKGAAAGTVKGYLNNSFSLNEYDGFLRVVSTYYDEQYNEQNGLYILDKDLKLTGSIENLAKGETIRSARFFGNTGYFVTFRQTDPLFSVDLSDPASPAVLGELKVSGFSSYLHFYGKDLLLGLGYEADENTGITSGVKLSMFDISDPSNVTELHRLVIPGVTWCPSLENYKSILISPEKNVFGFFCGDRYFVFSYDREQGFSSELIYDLLQDAVTGQIQKAEDTATGQIPEMEDVPGEIFQPLLSGTTEEQTQETAATAASETEIWAEDIAVIPEAGNDYPSISSYNTRGLYIGNTFCLAGDVSVITFDMSDHYQKLGTLTLDNP